jgi:hypothetical protein
LKIGSPRLDFPDWEQTRRLGRVEEEAWTEERRPLVPEQKLVLWPVRVPEVQRGLQWSGQARRRCGIERHRPFL